MGRRLLGLGLVLLTITGGGLAATAASAKTTVLTYKGDGTSDPKVDITFDVRLSDGPHGEFDGQIQDIDADYVLMTGCPNQPDRGMNLTFDLVEPIKIKEDGDFRGSYSANGLSQSFSGGLKKGDEDDLGVDPLRKIPRIQGLFKYGVQGDGYDCKTGRVEWKARAVRREVHGSHDPDDNRGTGRTRPAALPFFDSF